MNWQFPTKNDTVTRFNAIRRCPFSYISALNSNYRILLQKQNGIIKLD